MAEFSPPPGAAQSVAGAPLSRGARGMLWAIFAAILALRILCIRHFRIDSDEPQHLHIVWGWTHGLMQYREIFDNHTPLFHLACQPVLRLVGERADTLVAMRFAMMPLFFFSLWCVYRLGLALHSQAAGVWGAVFAALTPAFCFTFTEFRADDLWTAFWLLALVVLLGGEPVWRRGLGAGLLMGAAVATSLKTLALLGCLGAAAIAGLLLAGQCRAVFTTRRTYGLLASIFAGLLVVPALLAGWFASRHALDDALYGIFTYNSVPGLGRMRLPRNLILGLFALASLMAMLIPASAAMARRLIAPGRRFHFHLIFLGSGFYGALIYTLWPLLDAEHFIPFHPLFTLGLMPLALHGLARPSALRTVAAQRAALAALAFALIAVEAFQVRKDKVSGDIGHYAELLRLSDPADYVMDLKGETIFRQRPYRFLFEGVGILRARKHFLPDTIPERMIATRTCIAVPRTYRFIFPRALAFMDENYISTGAFRVLGHAMTPAADASGYVFQTVIPASFAFLSDRKFVPGKIDGQPCAGFATLAAGPHAFVPDTLKEPVDFVWKQAVDRGFFPDQKTAESAPRPPGKSGEHSP